MSSEAPSLMQAMDLSPPEDRLRLARQRIAIDAAARRSVLFFLASAVAWLLVGSLLGLVISLELYAPAFLGNTAWLTFGRICPAHINVMTYGWSSMAGVGLLLWLTSRLARASLVYSGLMVAAAAIWNLAVLAGTVGILTGGRTGIAWLEFPAFVPPLLAIALGMIAVSAVLTFRARRETEVYVSQWYLFAAVFWLPWLYSVACSMLIYRPVRGIAAASISAWYAHGIMSLWFAPIGLAVAYYVIPKVLGRPIRSYDLATLGFWSLALFGAWQGGHRLVGGPVPAWIVTVAIVADGLLLLHVAAVAINLHLTMAGHFHTLRFSPSLRFVVFGGMAYTVACVQGAVGSLRSVSVVTHFTQFGVAHSHLALYGFFSMVMFGGMYYVVPRLTGWEWASARWARVHFWCSGGGIALMWIALTVGGIVQGLTLANPKVPFIAIGRRMMPFFGLLSASGLLLTVGNVVFAILFVMNLLQRGERRAGPTLLGDAAAYVHALSPGDGADGQRAPSSYPEGESP